MAAETSLDGAQSNLKLKVGMDLMTPLQGPQSTFKGKALQMNAADWCKFERRRYKNFYILRLLILYLL